MIEAPTPTRAEASDVANAVFDGADTVMLSAETAAGAYPIEAVSIMARIIGNTEAHIAKHPQDGPAQLKVEPSVYHAVAQAAVKLADDINAAALVVFTATGNTAVRVSRERPQLPLVVMTPEIDVQRRLSMLWGARSYLQGETDYETAVQEARHLVLSQNIGTPGQQIIVVAGIPFGKSGSTNSMRVVDL